MQGCRIDNYTRYRDLEAGSQRYGGHATGEPCAQAPSKSKEPRQGRGSSKFLGRPALLEAGRDGGELGVQRAAEIVDDGDNRQRDAGGDQAVFNGGGAGFILHETRNEVLHGVLQMGTRGLQLIWSSRLPSAADRETERRGKELRRS